MAGPSIDIRSLIIGDFDQQVQTKLADVLDPAINNGASAETTASEIDKLFTGNEDAEEFLWPLWGFFVEVVKRIPHDDARLQVFASVLEQLKAKPRQNVEIWGSSLSVWADFPLLGAVMRESWNGVPEADGPDTAVSEWLSLNSFAARLVGSSVQPWDNFALWELRDGLEEPLSSPRLKDMYLTTASEWIIHAGKVLYEEGRTEVQLDDAEKRSLSPGELFSGKPGFSAERWKFWGKRLEELKAEAGSEDVKRRTEKALEVMKSLEG